MALSCDKCGRTFNRKWLWERHMDTVHNANAKYACTFPGCPKLFKRKDVLDRHEDCQHGIKKVQCENCLDRVRKDGLGEHRNSQKCQARTEIRRQAALLYPAEQPNDQLSQHAGDGGSPDSEPSSSTESPRGSLGSFDSASCSGNETVATGSASNVSTPPSDICCNFSNSIDNDSQAVESQAGHDFTNNAMSIPNASMLHPSVYQQSNISFDEVANLESWPFHDTPGTWLDNNGNVSSMIPNSDSAFASLPNAHNELNSLSTASAIVDSHSLASILHSDRAPTAATAEFWTQFENPNAFDSFEDLLPHPMANEHPTRPGLFTYQPTPPLHRPEQDCIDPNLLNSHAEPAEFSGEGGEVAVRSLLHPSVDEHQALPQLGGFGFIDFGVRMTLEPTLRTQRAYAEAPELLREISHSLQKLKASLDQVLCALLTTGQFESQGRSHWDRTNLGAGHQPRRALDPDTLPYFHGSPLAWAARIRDFDVRTSNGWNLENARTLVQQNSDTNLNRFGGTTLISTHNQAGLDLARDLIQRHADCGPFGIDDRATNSPLDGNSLNRIPPAPNNFICGDIICRSRFSTRSELSRHVRWHGRTPTGPYSCTTCAGRFGFAKDLRRHMLPRYTHVSARSCEELQVRNSSPSYQNPWTAVARRAHITGIPTCNFFGADPQLRDGSNAERTAGVPPLAASIIVDDTMISQEPSRYVDYLSHRWREEDIWASWRFIVSQRSVYGPQSRLEHASSRRRSRTNHEVPSHKQQSTCTGSFATNATTFAYPAPRRGTSGSAEGSHFYSSTPNELSVEHFRTSSWTIASAILSAMLAFVGVLNGSCVLEFATLRTLTCQQKRMTAGRSTNIMVKNYTTVGGRLTEPSWMHRAFMETMFATISL